MTREVIRPYIDWNAHDTGEPHYNAELAPLPLRELRQGDAIGQATELASADSRTLFLRFADRQRVHNHCHLHFLEVVVENQRESILGPNAKPFAKTAARGAVSLGYIAVFVIPILFAVFCVPIVNSLGKAALYLCNLPAKAEDRCPAKPRLLFEKWRDF